VETKLILGAAMLALLGGCVAQQNDRLTIGRSVRLEAFYPPEPTPAEEGAAVLAAQTPTLVRVWRDNWERTTILSPVDGTAHQPTYAKKLHLTDSSARQRREYPTESTALQLTEGSEQDQQQEAISNALYAAADVILLIPRMVIDPPWAIRWSPDVAYQRYWGSSLPAATPVETVPAEVVTPSRPEGPPPSEPAIIQPR
jgi:hypothetical protein